MPLLQQIRLENLLSFGPDTGTLQLRPLNVLIGPNGVGKSNLIEAINFYREAVWNLADTLRKSGGIQDWIRRGTPSDNCARMLLLVQSDVDENFAILHGIDFKEQANQFFLVDEFIQKFSKNGDGPFLYHFNMGNNPKIATRHNGQRELPIIRSERQRSILSQIIDSSEYPEVTYLHDQYERIRIYRDWSFGRNNPARQYQPADGRTNYLEADCSNLGMILSRIRRAPEQREQLLECLNDLYPNVSDVDVEVQGSFVAPYIIEGKHTIPATRLSDGTLRYLCLLAILLHPTPPPLICIEEPELGLHPDVMPAMARLLKQASERTQLIVTTHSEVLVDALGDTPEDVVVCEKHDGCTTFNRLDGEKLKVWLKDYSLGMLWRKGEIGGNRW